ncbi:MAG: carboxypeptidase regulatory-like domain-containing protein [Bryobacteraceae bacterium]
MRRPVARSIILFLPCLIASAQTTGSVEGTIFDPSGKAVPGVVVTVSEVSTNAVRKITSDGSGRYLASALAPGNYRIEAAQPGFQQVRQDAVAVDAARAVRVDIRMSLGLVQETVSVSGQAPLVDLNASSWGGALGRKELDSLPLNGRDMFDLAAQETGATIYTTANRSLPNGAAAAVSVNGGRPNQNSFRLDNVTINDATSGAPASAASRTLGVESISELRLVTSPFHAEFGRFSGGVITAVSRSGVNRLHGSLYEFLRNSSLDAKNFFDSAGEPIPPLRRNQFGGMISGPIRRDRLFFLVNYEGLRERTAQTLRVVTISKEARAGRIAGQAPIAVSSAVLPYVALFPLPNSREFDDGTGEYAYDSKVPTREDYLSTRVDYSPGQRLRLYGRYTADNAESSEHDAPKIYRYLDDSNYQFAHAEAQWLKSARTVFQFRAAFSRVRNSELAEARKDLPGDLSFLPGRSVGSIQVTGLSHLSGTALITRPRYFVVNDFQFQHDATLIRGLHTVRFGAGYDRVRFNHRVEQNVNGLYRFGSVSDFLQARTLTADYTLPASDASRGWRYHMFNGWLQDDMRLSQRLFLTAGVRYEGHSVPTEVNGKLAVLRRPRLDSAVTVGGPLYLNPTRRNFAPRVAVSWDPLGGGRTILRAGAGLFFDLLGTRDIANSGVRTPPFFQRVVVSNPPFPRLPTDLSASGPLSVDTPDFHPEQPYMGQVQFSVQRQLDEETVVTAGYSGSRGAHLLGYVGAFNTYVPQVLADGRLFFPANAPVTNPAFLRIASRVTQFNSFYHGFHVSAKRRQRRGLGVQAKYSFGKVIDETSSITNSSNVGLTEFSTPYSYRANRGLADFDLRHVFAANFSWEIPGAATGVAGKLTSGWQLHGLVQAQSGAPFNPVVGFDRIRLTPENIPLSQRPDFIAALGARVVLGGPDQYFDPLAFGLPAAGYYGTLGRNTLIGPGLAALNLAAHKSLWRTERHDLRLRVEAFNVTNHPNFQIPLAQALFNTRLQRQGSAGRITSTTTSARQIQLALRWAF